MRWVPASRFNLLRLVASLALNDPGEEHQDAVAASAISRWEVDPRDCFLVQRPMFPSWALMIQGFGHHFG